MLGSRTKPRLTPQKPGKVAIVVALGLYGLTRVIKHLQIIRLLSIESLPAKFKLTRESQQAVPGIGSGDPYEMNVEQEDNNVSTVVQSTVSETAAYGIIRSRIRDIANLVAF